MQLGARKEGGLAMSVVSIDSPISDSLLAQVQQLPNVLSVKQIRI